MALIIEKRNKGDSRAKDGTKSHVEREGMVIIIFPHPCCVPDLLYACIKNIKALSFKSNSLSPALSSQNHEIRYSHSIQLEYNIVQRLHRLVITTINDFRSLETLKVLIHMIGRFKRRLKKR
jgi:hypothetical protein